MKQLLNKNWLILILCLALILIFVFGGMYFRHVMYVEPTTENTSENHISLSKTQILQFGQVNNTLIMESEQGTIFVHITLIDSLHGGAII